MKMKMIDRDVVYLVTCPELMFDELDNPPTTGPRLITRELRLRPAMYRGRRVLRAYDRESDTMYMKATS